MVRSETQRHLRMREGPDNEGLIKQGSVLSSSCQSSGLVVAGTTAVHTGSTVSGTANAQSVLETF